MQLFSKKHNAASYALNKWFKTVRTSTWSTHADVKATFSDVDYM
ncbi:hypothetical protein [Pedobacter flavus]|uniref:Uncharacterized protein n=1 Tax=Pedobacter flavus TaxID=3113906 RepID=A0ABU7GYF0_9SPHI|nr:hypothetical protein [Pedobacter sp. VNH31]MEE1884021.1 hypothetical protein [Pedobacter sp. VNH31]